MRPPTALVGANNAAFITPKAHCAFFHRPKESGPYRNLSVLARQPCFVTGPFIETPILNMSLAMCLAREEQSNSSLPLPALYSWERVSLAVSGQAGRREMPCTLDRGREMMTLEPRMFASIANADAHCFRCSIAKCLATFGRLYRALQALHCFLGEDIYGTLLDRDRGLRGCPALRCCMSHTRTANSYTRISPEGPQPRE